MPSLTDVYVIGGGLVAGVVCGWLIKWLRGSIALDRRILKLSEELDFAVSRVKVRDLKLQLGTLWFEGVGSRRQRRLIRVLFHRARGKQFRFPPGSP